jgi:DNA gyrase subunit B
MAGFCKNINVTIHFDNSVTIEDDGRGIPVDMHVSEGKPAAEVVLTTLHAGGKFNSDSYKVSGGLHGVGVSVVNALSDKLELEIKRGGGVYFQKYQAGKPTTKFKKIGKSSKKGTKITFWPDEEIFEETEFKYEIIAKRLKQMSFLNAGITIILIDERHDIDKKEEFYFEGGLRDYIKDLVGSKDLVHETPIYFKATQNEVEVEICFQYVQSYNENIYSFVNNIHTVEGGTHLTGFKGALTRTINSFAKANNLIKKEFKEVFSGEDVREGINVILSVKHTDPQFEGQTKAKLGNSEVKGIVESFVNEKLTDFFEENISTARSIINKAFFAATARLASRKAKELVRKTNLLENFSLPGKLADCQSKDPANSELFIVEGDSAGGSAKQGRDRKYQAILPLRGKILNVQKTSIDRMLENNEIKTLISALGVGISKEHFDIEKLRYHKVIIMTDADVDGSHIRTLLMTFFFKHMRELIDGGYLYLAQPPLFLVKYHSQKTYLKNEKEFENFIFNIIETDVILKNTTQDLEKNDLVNFLKLSHKKNKLITKITKRGFPLPLINTLIEMAKDEDTFRDKQKTESIADSIKQLTCCNSLKLDFDEEYSLYCINLQYEHQGIARTENIDWNFLTGPLFAKVNECHEKLRDFPKPPYNIFYKNEEFVISNTDKLIPVIFDKINSNLKIQRYKGLGEMNPDQLWETTLDRKNRTLLNVEINDYTGSEELFETLMGSEPQKRKDFILKNALHVKNLDI